ncbi:MULTISPECIES: SRPBCC family protein [Amycolatopsis]|uniref:SRPBCC family protein n=1 Tax=Amycolatopsis albidoflavus TaxID=102226 RepID=A0ABW5HRH2_9PSEU
METTAEQTEQTRSSIVIPAAPARVMAVIADVAAYPEWIGEITRAQVLDRDLEGRAARVRLSLDAASILDEQVLAYRWDGDRSASWTLESSRILEKLDGTYTLAAAGAGTRAVYRLATALKVPVPSVVLRQAERVVIDRALAGLARRVENTAG